MAHQHVEGPPVESQGVLFLRVELGFQRFGPHGNVLGVLCHFHPVVRRDSEDFVGSVQSCEPCQLALRDSSKLAGDGKAGETAACSQWTLTVREYPIDRTCIGTVRTHLRVSSLLTR
jgi:hypothetical protein